MKRLVLMVGLPRSGKSTRALEISRQLPAPIVSPDAIRVAIHGHTYIPRAEPLVWAIAKTMVLALFEAGHDTIIIDACNNTRARREEWRLGNWEIVYEIIDTDKNLCLSRTTDPNLIEAINRMHAAHEPVTDDEGRYRCWCGDKEFKDAKTGS